LQGGGKRTHKCGECLVNVVTKIGMDCAVLPLDLGEDLPDGGVETCIPLVSAAGDVCVQLRQRVRQGLFHVLHGRDLLGDFAQVVAFRRQGARHTSIASHCARATAVVAARPCAPGAPRLPPGAEECPDTGGEPHGQRPPEGDTQSTHRHPGTAHARRHPSQEREADQGRASNKGEQTRLRGEGGDEERQGTSHRKAARRRPCRLERTRPQRLGNAEFVAGMRA
jgi:hypothetical protein